MSQYNDLLNSYENNLGYIRLFKVLLQFRTKSVHKIRIEINDIIFIEILGG